MCAVALESMHLFIFMEDMGNHRPSYRLLGYVSVDIHLCAKLIRIVMGNHVA